MKGYKNKIWTMFSNSYKHFYKNGYISGTLGGAVFRLLRYLRDMVSIIPTDFCADMSNGLKYIAVYDRFHSGRHMV